MGKRPKSSPSGSRASKTAAASSNRWSAGVGLAVAVIGVAAAVGAQRLLTASPSEAAAADASIKAAEANGPTKRPTRCIDGWTDCPRVPGTDWVALAELESLPESAPDAEMITQCLRQPEPLLSK